MNKKILSILITVAIILLTASLPVYAYVDKEDKTVEKRLEQNVFHDITEDKWYADPVIRARERGIMNGISTWFFSPESYLTREMAVTILHRMEVGYSANNNTGEKTSFDDVDATSWYASSVVWASEAEITVGIGDNTFGVGKAITREELTTLITRYLDHKNRSLTEKVDTVPTFNDADSISDWAVESLDALCRSGVIKGDDKGNFRPGDKVTRAEAAAIFVRLDDAFIFETSDIFAFEDEEVATIELSLFVAGRSDKIKITDTEEVKELLDHLRNMKISYTKTKGLLEVGTESTTIVFLNENGEQVKCIEFNPDFLRDSARLYVLDSAYLQEYSDMLDALKDSMFK